jgi:beta-mannosidase
VTFQNRDGSWVVAVDNQSGEWWEGMATVRRMHVDGTVLADEVVPFGVRPRSVESLPLSVEISDPGTELLVVDVEGLRDVVLGCPDAEFAYPGTDLGIDVSPLTGGLAVTVTARTFVRDLLLQADRLAPDAEADQGLMTLLPGETRTITVRGGSASQVDPAAVRAALFSVNGAQARLDEARPVPRR